VEVRFATFDTDSKFLYTEEHSKCLSEEEAMDNPAPLASLASCSKQAAAKAFRSVHFVDWVALTAGSVGMHSVQKCAASFSKTMGSTHDCVDIRGRWKGGKGGCTSTCYVNLEQPCVDDKACGNLCVDGAIKHKFKDGAHVGPAFFAEHHACPNTNKFYPASSKMSETLGLLLLWACFKPTIAS